MPEWILIGIVLILLSFGFISGKKNILASERAKAAYWEKLLLSDVCYCLSALWWSFCISLVPLMFAWVEVLQQAFCGAVTSSR